MQEYAISGLDHVVKKMSPDDAIDLLQDVENHLATCPSLQVCNLATQKITGMLSCDCGNELFWGYSNRFKTLMMRTSDLWGTLVAVY